MTDDTKYNHCRRQLHRTHKDRKILDNTAPHHSTRNHVGGKSNTRVRNEATTHLWPERAQQHSAAPSGCRWCRNRDGRRREARAHSPSLRHTAAGCTRLRQTALPRSGSLQPGHCSRRRWLCGMKSCRHAPPRL